MMLKCDKTMMTHLWSMILMRPTGDYLKITTYDPNVQLLHFAC